MAKPTTQEQYKQYHKQMADDARNILYRLQQHASKFKKQGSSKEMVDDLDNVRRLLRSVSTSLEVFTQ